MNVNVSYAWKPSFLTLFIIILLSSWFAAQLALGSGISDLLFIVIPVVFVIFLFFVVKNWRTGIWLLFGWLLLEDLMRKYMGNNMAVYFGKDVIAGVLYLSFYAARRRGEIPALRPPFWIPIVLFFWWALLEVFNPNSPSLWYGALGMKIYFYYVPLFFVGYAIFQNEADLQRFLRFNLILAGIIAVLGTIQAIVGPTFLNPATLGEDIRSLSTLTRYDPITGQSFYRPSSIFVSDGRFGAYLLLSWLFAAGSTVYWFVRRLPGKSYVLFVLGSVSLAIVLGGGRTPLVLSTVSLLLLVAGFRWGLPSEYVGHYWGAKALWAAVILAAITILAVTVFSPEAAAPRVGYYEATLLSPRSDTYQLEDRALITPIGQVVQAFQDPNWVFGYGTGTYSLGTQYVTRILNVPRLEVGVESGYGALVLEMGIVGLLLWLLWTGVLLFSAWGVVRRLRGTVLFPIGLVIGLFSFVVLVALTAESNSGYQNFVVNAYLWLLLGILFRLPELLQMPEDRLVSTGH
ncbi:MAG TPA: hypothetical protein VGT24_12590 [Candidatus Acidoferrales bacterium]|nr:hypothetical protein [Candidatus Acidoferrales bacterium]